MKFLICVGACATLLAFAERGSLGADRLEAEPQVHISGQVRDSSSKPIAGVNVRVLREGRTVGEGKTDTRGSYSINVEPGGGAEDVEYFHSAYVSHIARKLTAEDVQGLSVVLRQVGELDSPGKANAVLSVSEAAISLVMEAPSESRGAIAETLRLHEARRLVSELKFEETGESRQMFASRKTAVLEGFKLFGIQ